MTVSQFWDNIAYIVQLIFAAIAIVLPFPKREHWIVRGLLASALMILISYYASSLDLKMGNAAAQMLYWLIFALAVLPFMYFLLDGSLRRAALLTGCACAVQHIAFDGYRISLALGLPAFVYVILFAITYLLAWRFFAIPLRKSIAVRNPALSFLPTISVGVLIFILSVLEMSETAPFEATPQYRILYRLVDAMCCIYILWVQIYQMERRRLESELIGVNQAWEMKKEQYEIKQGMIDSINRKCHDLRHQIRALQYEGQSEEFRRYIDGLEKDIMIYDTSIDTGNRALDIILMDRGIYCKNHNIRWSCMIDGRRLSMMKPEDIYAVFGNVIDNAVEAAEHVTNPEKREVSLRMISHGQNTIIQVQNFYEGKLVFHDGLPRTTKGDEEHHGFGMKSARHTIEQYGGVLTAAVKDDRFTLQIML
ncbi:GHKL domain-containing protein [Lachnospiraceae bacterium NK3A20]|nr:GHKL domain-containing protein [Lachnospiraceae bacterium NK3A20]